MNSTEKVNIDFIANVNESLDLRFEEMGELGSPVFVLIDIDNTDRQNRFYPEDLSKFINFLNHIQKVPDQPHEINVNESYNLKYSIHDAEGVVTLEDLDFDDNRYMYPEDVTKIVKFLNRLHAFGII